MTSLTIDYKSQEFEPLFNFTLFIEKLNKSIRWFLGIFGFIFIFVPLAFLFIFPLFLLILRKIYKDSAKKLKSERLKFDSLTLEEKFQYYYQIEARLNELNQKPVLAENLASMWVFKKIENLFSKLTILYSNYSYEYNCILFPKCNLDISEADLINFEKFSNDWNGEEWISEDIKSFPLNV